MAWAPGRLSLRLLWNPRRREMLPFLITLALLILFLIVLTLVIQLVGKMKLVPPSRLAVVNGRGGSFRMYRGGRVFVFPLINQFSTMDLTPQTTTVVVESAIAKGIVPLTVKATVSHAVAKSERGMINAVKRILHLTDNWVELNDIATSIIEGHLRDSIAAMTPEEVMSHKDRLIQNMIKVCKADLEGIGLEITTMNIADVEDHRLEGVKEPDLYIALLKRIQTANAESQSREAKATARATAKEQEEARRADVGIRALDNEQQQLTAQTKVRVAQEKQRGAVGAQEAARNAESQVAGMRAQIEAEKQRIEMVKAQLEATTIVPAGAARQKMVENARGEAAQIRGRAQAQLEQLGRTISILQGGGDQAMTAYVIEKFGDLVGAFAETMDLFPVEHSTVISGRRQPEGPISAIHPSAVDANLNERIAQLLGLDGAPKVAKTAA
jgi:flotillin